LRRITWAQRIGPETGEKKKPILYRKASPIVGPFSDVMKSIARGTIELRSGRRVLALSWNFMS
jgi:hypothetical protein